MDLVSPYGFCTVKYRDGSQIDLLGGDCDVGDDRMFGFAEEE